MLTELALMVKVRLGNSQHGPLLPPSVELFTSMSVLVAAHPELVMLAYVMSSVP
jgi:hypothetical protein